MPTSTSRSPLQLRASDLSRQFAATSRRLATPRERPENAPVHLLYRRAVRATAALLLSATQFGLLASACAGSRSDSWQTLAPAPLARTEVAAARVGKFIYVIGGFAEGTGSASRTVERYDIDANRWRRVAPLPIPIQHAAAASYRGRLYVVGGYQAERELTRERDTLYRYSPRTNDWRRLTSMPTERGALAAIVLGSRLYAIGGSRHGSPLKTVEVYDFARRRWSRGPSLKTAREHIAAAAAHGSIFVFAGRAASGNLASVERLARGEGRWRPVDDIPTARSGIAAAAVDDEIVVFGGEEATGTIAPVQALNAKTLRWRSLPPMKTPRHGLGGASDGTRVYAIEGGPEPGFAFSDALEVLRLKH